MSSDLCSPFHCNICLFFESSQEKDQDDLSTNKSYQHLLTCSGCQLIKYCNSQHQKLDWPIHQQFCRAVQKIKDTLKINHPFYIAGAPKDIQQIEKTVIQLKYLLKNALGRSLEYHEEELTSFPAFCGQCYKMKGLKHVCTECCSQTYCSEEHKELHRRKHDQVCRLLQIYYCPYKVQPLKENICRQFVSRVNDLHKKDLYACIEKIFGLQLPSNPGENLQTYQMFSWAADFSCIMTICCAMELSEFKELDVSKFNIIILGAGMEAVLWFREVHCKLFFLQNPQIEMLELNFVGPEVVQPNYEELKFTFLGCERLVKFKIFKGLFQDYCKYFKVQASLIMAFNCGFSEFSQYYNLSSHISSVETLKPLNGDWNHTRANDTWFEGLVEISHIFNTPIVFTSFTEQEAEFDFAAFQNAVQTQKLKIHIDRIFKTFKNSFHDLRPLRQWYSFDPEEFYFRNGYMQAVCTRADN